MDVKELKKVLHNIDFMKDHFESSACQCGASSRYGPIFLADLQEKLLSQDAYIRSLVNPVQHNSALYQAKRLVAMLQDKPV